MCVSAHKNHARLGIGFPAKCEGALRKLLARGEPLNVTLGEAFGDVVRELRHGRSESQETVAWRIQMDRSYLSELENGRKVPSLKTVFRLAGALDTDPNTLVARVEKRMESSASRSEVAESDA